MFRSFKGTAYIRDIYEIYTGYVRNISEARANQARPRYYSGDKE